jgi:ribonuclease-3
VGVEPTDDEAAREALPERLGITFRNAAILEAALTHRSYAYERGLTETNERLELLGDAVLNLVVTDMIYKTFPTYLEGDLAKLRASLVSAPALADVASDLDLGRAIRLGRGEELTGGRSKPSIVADALEAVLGAVYLDRGLTAVRQVIRTLFGSRIDAAVGKEVPRDPKTQLQEYVTRLNGTLPYYRVTGAGPDHAKLFRAEVFVGDDHYGTGSGRSKKEAEQAAAAEAMSRLARERAQRLVADSGGECA